MRRLIPVLTLLALLLPGAPAAAQPWEPAPGCGNAPGAPPGAPVIDSQGELNAAMADGDVTDRVIDFNWSDDQVNVDGDDLTMKRVTFRGSGDGHTIKVTRGARFEGRALWFDSDPLEDHVQGEGHGFILIRCSQSGAPGEGSGYGNPGDPENAVDLKAGGDAHVLRNRFYAARSQGECFLANNGAKTVRFEDNDPCNGGGVYMRGNVTGTMLRNNVNGQTRLDEVNDMLIERNKFDGHTVRYGADSSPNGNYFLGNRFGTNGAWDYRSGGCHREANDVRLDPCRFGPPTWYP